MATEFNWNRVSHYEECIELPESGEYVELEVFTNYGGFEEFQSVSYSFPESDQGVIDSMEDFRLSYDIPAVINDFKGFPCVSILLPEKDRLEAVSYAEERLEKLDKCLT